MGRHVWESIEELSAPPHLWIHDRRTWEAYRTQAASFLQRISEAVSHPLWQRVRRRRLRHALTHWKRVDRILAAQDGLKRLVEHQRSYLLRKLLLSRYWRSLSFAFCRWIHVCRCYVRLELQVQKWIRKTVMGAAIKKWCFTVQTERLEEEAAACLSVLSRRRVERLYQRVTRRANSERLVSCWVKWKSWYRQQRCLAWRHGLSLAMRKYFIAWKLLYEATRQKKQQLEQYSRAVVVSCIDDSVAQNLWHQRIRDRQADQLVHVVNLLARWVGRVQLARMHKSLSVWKHHASQVQEVRCDAISEEPRIPLPVLKKLRFPERFTAAYREDQRRSTDRTRQHLRPQWR